jgi:hypothetical protein
VFEKRVLRKIFGPKRDEVTGGWRKLHNEELRDLYSSPSIIRIINSMGRANGGYEELISLERKLEGKRSLVRPRRRWEDIMKMGLGEIGWDGMDWIGLTHGRDKWRTLVKAETNIRVP